jgi:protease I
MCNVLLVIPPERFRDEELFETKAALQRAGHRCSIASTKTGVCAGSRGGAATAKIKLCNVKDTQFDAIVFVGGGGSKLLFNDRGALALARSGCEKGKVIAAICLAPVILANAGVLKGRRATVAGTEAKTISKQGAIYTGPGVMVDGNIVTANAPKASRAFGEEINRLLLTGSPARIAAHN